jgi:hypothetical protein
MNIFVQELRVLVPSPAAVSAGRVTRPQGRTCGPCGPHRVHVYRVDARGTGVCVAAERICAAAHIRSYAEFRNMWSLWPGRPVILYNRANLPHIFLAAFSIVKGMHSINLSANLSPKIPFLREFAQFPSRGSSTVNRGMVRLQ